jgi:hypothetical protein
MDYQRHHAYGQQLIAYPLILDASRHKIIFSLTAVITELIKWNLAVGFRAHIISTKHGCYSLIISVSTTTPTWSPLIFKGSLQIFITPAL